MGKGRPEKYNRVSCHQKFMLRRLILVEKKSVKEAALFLGINYSTAKTIMFFHRKPTSASPPISSPLSTSIFQGFRCVHTAGFCTSSNPKKIEIISSVGRISWTSPKLDPPFQSDGVSSCKIQNSI